jgi:hypothetical protein
MKKAYTCKDPLMAAEASAKVWVVPKRPPVPAFINPGALRNLHAVI